MCRVVSLALILLLTNLPASPASHSSVKAAMLDMRQEQVAPAPLTNKDVLEMVKAKLATEVVISKIKTSPSKFDTSPAALQELKNGSVPDAVMLAMIDASARTTANANAASAGARAQEIKIPDGTPLDIQLMFNISSKEAKEGDTVYFTALNPVVVEGVTVVERGAPATARIVVAKKSGHWGKAGKLAWVMQDVIAADGSRIPLRMSKKLAGDSKGGTVATATIVTGLVFWPAAPFWGFKKGKDAVFRAGKQFEAFVHGESKVQGNIRNAGTVTP